ncbi:hypothetical protein MNBD_GAMMA04-704 [hydrothermal vent metagenome]|uniref:Uncharacterized protein n=1 Tax=hydrothermal vent metagenome TaxID=652676 RepID=A0A3B0W918_9ZZZZ
MQNSFGAKISHPANDSALQPYLAIFDKSTSIELRNHDITKANKFAQQIFFIDPNLNYSLIIANQSQAEHIKKLPSISKVGGINIDFERFQQIMSGNF